MSDASTTTTTALAPPQEAATLTTALLEGPRPPRPSAARAALTFGWRGMLKIKHVPEQLIDVTLTPVLFTLLFTYVYGGAIAGSTDAYLQYILPGILAMSVLFTTVYSGVALNTDMTKGVVDRFRSLPIWRPAPLAGAVLGDAVRYLVAGTVVVAVGLALGYRPDGGVEGVVGAMLVVVAFAFGLSWAFTTLGLLLRAPNAVMNAGFMALFPLVFVSNGFVEPDTLPGWLETIVDINPISHVITAARGPDGRRPVGRRHRAGAHRGGRAHGDLRPADGAALPDQELTATVLDIDTPHGPARAHLRPAGAPRGALVLGHGAGGGVAARDLVTAAEVAVEEGLAVALVEQPYRVAGPALARPGAPARRRLDRRPRAPARGGAGRPAR